MLIQTTGLELLHRAGLYMDGIKRQPQTLEPHVQEVIRSAERELGELLQLRTELIKRIGTIKQTVAGLANIFGDSVLSD